MQQKEKYILHWQSYSDHLKEALNDMMLSSEFADVTLVSDDKQQIRAHRNILSAASPVAQFSSFLPHENWIESLPLYRYWGWYQILLSLLSRLI